MSTQQPPGGPAEGGYAQPQDPWGGYEPGVASVPTDPIPQQQYDQYAAMAPGEVWSQPTVAQGGPYGYVPQQPQPGRTGKLIGITLLVLVLAGGAGYGAYWYLNQNTGITGVSGTTTPTATTASPTEAAFDPHVVKVGDCLENRGTDLKPELHPAACGAKGIYKVLKVLTGPDIQEGPKGTFDKDTTAPASCGDTNYNAWYAFQDAVDDNKDVFFCMTKQA